MAQVKRRITTFAVIFRLLIAMAIAGLAGCGGGAAAGSSAALIASPLTAAQSLKAKPPSGPGMTANGPSLVNTTTAGDQIAASIGALADGGYEVVWLSTADRTLTFYLQRYDALGAKVGIETPIQFDFGVANAAGKPTIAVLSDGSLVAAYPSSRVISTSATSFVQSSGIYSQRFDPAGLPVGGETQVAVIVRDLFAAGQVDVLTDPVMLTWTDGTYLVGWTVRHQLGALGTFPDYATQLFDSGGAPAGAPVHFSGGGNPISCSTFKLTAIADGGYIAAVSECFMGSRFVQFIVVNSATHSGTIGTRQDASGLPLGSTLVALNGGGYVLWSIGPTGPYVQMLDSTGNPVGASTPVASLPSSAVALGDGGYLALWVTTGSSLTAQRFDAAGALVGDRFPIDASGAIPLLAPLIDGSLAAAWTVANPTAGLDVMTQLFEPADFAPGKQARKRACQLEAKTQGLTGQDRKAFMTGCLAA